MDQRVAWGIAMLGAVDLLCVEAVVLSGSSEHTAGSFDARVDRHLARVDEAFARNATGAALSAWQEAHVAAAGQPPVGEVDRCRRRRPNPSDTCNPDLPGAGTRGIPRRTVPTTVGVRVDGVLRTAEAFVALGDRQVAEQCPVLINGPQLTLRERLLTLEAQLRVGAPSLAAPSRRPMFSEADRLSTVRPTTNLEKG